MIKANEANKIAKLFNKENKQNQLNEMDVKVKNAAEQGDYSLRLEEFPYDIEEELKELGYNIERKDTGFGGTSSITLSW